MGLGNFIYASNLSRFGLKGLGVMGPGVLSTFLIVKLAREYHYFKKQARWFKTQNSTWLTEKGEVYYRNGVPLVVNGLTNLGFTFVMTFAQRFAKMGGMNQGIISTLVSFASVFNVFLFAKIFNEQVTRSQLLGILLIILAVCCFAMSSTSVSKSSDDGIETQTFYCIFALTIGMIAPIIMSLKHVVIRMYKGSYDPISQAIDGFLIEYALMSVATFSLVNDPNIKLSW